MHFSNSPIITALLLSTHPALSFPTAHSLVPRTDYCANAPNVVAGTLLPARSLPHDTRTPPNTPIVGATRWCAPNSRTYIYVTLTAQMGGPAIRNLLDTALRFSQDYIHLMGDGVMPAEGLTYIPIDGFRVIFANANNHQITWGVYGAALVALSEFMDAHGWGTAVFRVIDGSNAVATGAVSQVPYRSGGS